MSSSAPTPTMPAPGRARTAGGRTSTSGSAGGLATSPAWTITGDENNALVGGSVATAGDVNGDGYSDVIVGAYAHDTASGAGANRGRAYVYLGSSGGLATSPAWTGSGDENGALYGASVATAGDVDGNGYADILVGAYFHDSIGGANANRGRAYLYMSSAAGPALIPGWTLSGDENNASLGSVARDGGRRQRRRLRRRDRGRRRA